LKFSGDVPGSFLEVLNLGSRVFVSCSCDVFYGVASVKVEVFSDFDHLDREAGVVRRMIYRVAHL